MGEKEIILDEPIGYDTAFEKGFAGKIAGKTD